MKKSGKAILAAGMLAVAAIGTTAAVAQITTTNVQFPRGATSTRVNGTIIGGATRDYVVRASAGQTLRVTKSGSPIVYFNVLPPGSNDVAIFVGSTSGNSFTGPLRRTGAYKIRVYQMRATARRGERGAFALSISVTGRPGIGAGPGTRPPVAGGSGLSGLRGMNSIAAIDLMSARGFANVDSFSSGNTQYGIFYNRSIRMCAQLTMANGRVVSADDIHTHPKCR